MRPLILVVALLAAHLVFAWVNALRSGHSARLRGQGDSQSTGASQTAVTILIPAWNEAKTVTRCIESLLLQTHREWKAVIIAGGPDGTLQLANGVARHDSRIRVIEQAPRGKNAALADALEVADGDVMVILDADSVVEPSWLTSMLVALADGISAVCGNYYPLRRSWVSQSEQMEKVSSYLVHDHAVLQGSGSIAVYRDALEQAGGFPSGVTVGVDWDLDTRLKQQGQRVSFAQNARVLTERPATLREYWRNEIRWRRAHLAAIRRHRQGSGTNPFQRLLQLRFYAMATATALATAALAVGAIIGVISGWYTMMWLALAFLLWIAGRRAAVAAEVAAYEGRWQTVTNAWMPVVLLFVSFAASLWVLLTPGKLPVHFQGPRSVAGSLEGQTTEGS